MHSGEKSNNCNHSDYASSRAGDLRRHFKTHTGEKPFPVIGAHSAVASTVEKNQTNLLLGMQFKETFKDPQWRKVKQMQPMRLCLLSGK